MARRRPGEGTIWVEVRSGGQKRYRIRGQLVLPGGQTVIVNASGRTEAIARQRYQINLRNARLAGRGISAQSLQARCEAWLDEKVVDVSARTLDQYRNNLEIYVYPVLGHRPLVEVTTPEIQALLTNLRASGRLTTADYVRRVLKQMFSHSVRDGILPHSPMTEIRGQRKNRRAVLGEDGTAEQELQLWRPEEVTLFLAALDGVRIREMLVVALFTGLRRGEILALRWEDVGPNDTYLHVRRAYDPFEPGKVGPPKSRESVRKVPLGDAARHAIRITRQRRAYEQAHYPAYRDEGWVFPSKRGTMMEGRNYYRAFKQAIARVNEEAESLEMAGLPATKIRDIRLHGLRHTYASYLARAGHPPAVIQRLLGHASPDLALRVYTHVIDDDLERAVLNLDDIVG